MDETFDPEDLAAAETLDAEIDRALAGAPSRTADQTVLWLATAMRAELPGEVGQRIQRDHERREQARWRPAQLAAAALAALLLTHGIGSIVNGAWVADGLGEHYSPHAYIEGGLALLAAGVVVAAGLFRRTWLPISVTAGVPLGLVLGVRGIPELGQFAAGAALHLSEGVAAAALALIWWRTRRYTTPRADEDRA